ncbi:hypothetical protein N9M55_05380 [Luminiphilus sp.]|nr:hypothetical protein [Luminiphilus sp.]
MKYLFTVVFFLWIASAQSQSISSLESGGGADKLRILDGYQIVYADEMKSFGIEPDKIIGDVALVSKGGLQKDLPQQNFMKPAEAQVVVTLGNSDTMGITHGQVIVEYYDRGSVDSLLQDYSMLLVLELHGLNRVVVKIQNLSRLNEALEELSSDFRIKSTELMVNFGGADLQ